MVSSTLPPLTIPAAFEPRGASAEPPPGPSAASAYARLVAEVSQPTSAIAGALRGIVHTEAGAVAKHVVSLELARLDGRLLDLEGALRASEGDREARHRGAQDWQGEAEKRLAQLSVEIDAMGARVKNGLKDAKEDREKRFTELTAHVAAEKACFSKMVREEVGLLKQTVNSGNYELHKLVRNLERTAESAQQEKDDLRTRCEEMTNTCREDLSAELAMLRASHAELSAVTKSQHESCCRDLAAASQASQEALEKVRQVLWKRIDDLLDQATSWHKEAESGIQAAEQSAASAVTSTAEAWQGVDVKLQNMIQRGSDDLVARLAELSAEAARREFAATIDEDELTKKIEVDLYGIVSREALQANLSAMVDRAVQRLQVVSDDVALRSTALQDAMAGAERRLTCSTQTLDTRVAAAERLLRKLPPEARSKAAAAAADGADDGGDASTVAATVAS
eukprot:TRINITY_DN73237_c0_g1_i1.p1 TRINITY_DN73237_c0_g1~~TRINITY_DN73237_c0_g1_i1.p1  ORF type:complete len:452 (-),score=136.78 TRINITY_DN73237_c0_g1_i1:90-1445(-)